MASYVYKDKTDYEEDILYHKALYAVLLLLLVLFPLAAADGEAVRTVSLDEALESAAAENIDLQSASLTLQQTLRSNDSATDFIPDLYLTGSIGGTGSLVDMSGSWSGSASLGINWEMASTDFTSLRVKEAARSLAYLTAESSTKSVEDSVIDAYFNLGAMYEAVRVSEENVRLSQEELDSVQAAYDAGQATSLALSQAKYNLLSAQGSLSSQQGSLRLAEITLRSLTGLEGDFIVEEVGDVTYMDLPDAQTLYDDYAAGTLALRTAEAGVASASAGLSSTKASSYWPTLSVSAGYSFGVNKDAVSYNGRNYGDNASVTVSMSIPISSWIPSSSGDVAVKNAQDSLTQAKLSLQDAKDSLMTGIESSLQQLSAAEDDAKLAQASLAVAQESYDLSKAAYDAGQLSLSDLNSARTSLYTSQLSLVNAKYSYVSTAYDLASLLDVDLDALESQYKENS